MCAVVDRLSCFKEKKFANKDRVTAYSTISFTKNNFQCLEKLILALQFPFCFLSMASIKLSQVLQRFIHPMLAKPSTSLCGGWGDGAGGTGPWLCQTSVCCSHYLLVHGSLSLVRWGLQAPCLKWQKVDTCELQKVSRKETFDCQKKKKEKKEESFW